MKKKKGLELYMNYESSERECYTLTDEDGNEIVFEVIGQMEYAGSEYRAMIPADAENTAECEYVILKTVIDGGEKMLTTIDDDAEFEAVADRFDALFAEEIENDY